LLFIIKTVDIHYTNWMFHQGTPSLSWT